MAFRLQSVYHPVGTATMAPRVIGGVVNSRLVVYGTTNLRVVDASIMPIHLATHIQQTVYAIAEKVSFLLSRVSLMLTEYVPGCCHDQRRCLACSILLNLSY